MMPTISWLFGHLVNRHWSLIRHSGLVIAILLGASCASERGSRPGAATAEVRVVGKPKAGVPESPAFVHVAVYDAAPAAVVPTGEFEHVDYAHLSNIIVWLEPNGAAKAAPPLSLTVELPFKAPTRFLAASVGQELRFHNTSKKAMPVYSVSDGNDFSLPAIPAGGTASYTVRSEGQIEVLSDPKQPPVAELYAAPSAYVAATSAGHTVTFRDVPAGGYTVVAWHPRLPGTQATLTLSADQVTRSTVILGVNSLPSSP
jgi:hypothetical protein